MFRRIVAGMLALTASGGLAREALAWGAAGHEWISGIAAEQLPDEIPAFVRTRRPLPPSPWWAANLIARNVPAWPTMPNSIPATM